MQIWPLLEKIEQLNLEVGLSRVSGLKEVYEKSLRLMLDEISVCCEKLHNYAENGDVQNFRVAVHGIKSSFANIGAECLSAQALELENAAKREDMEFIKSRLNGFISEMKDLERELSPLFERGDLGECGKIGPEESEALRKLKSALEDMDFLAIDDASTELEAFSFNGAVAARIDKIKDLILVMDYDEATEIISEICGG